MEAECSVEADDTQPEPRPTITKPKRGSSGFFFYLREVHGGRPSKQSGVDWKALDEERRARFEGKAKEDKARYEAEMEIYKAAVARGDVAVEACAEAGGEAPMDTTELPMSRVRKLVTGIGGAEAFKGKMSKEGLFALCKSAEFFLEAIAEQSAGFARQDRRKGILLQDVGRTIYSAKSADLLYFLHDDMNKARVLAKKAGAPKVQKKRSPGIVGVSAGGAAAADAGGGGRGRPAKRKEMDCETLQPSGVTMTNFFSRRVGPYRPAELEAVEATEAAVEEEEEEEAAVEKEEEEEDEEDMMAAELAAVEADIEAEAAEEVESTRQIGAGGSRGRGGRRVIDDDDE